MIAEMMPRKIHQAIGRPADEPNRKITRKHDLGVYSFWYHARAQWPIRQNEIDWPFDHFRLLLSDTEYSCMAVIQIIEIYAEFLGKTYFLKSIEPVRGLGNPAAAI